MEINDFSDLYHFLFETYAGIGVLVAAGIILSIIACIIFEIRTRKLYHNHELPPEEDEWSIFDAFEEGEEEQEAKNKAQD